MAETRLTKDEIIALAHANGFQDVGFTSAAPLDTHRTFLENRQKEYGWALGKPGGYASRNALVKSSPTATASSVKKLIMRWRSVVSK